MTKLFIKTINTIFSIIIILSRIRRFQESDILAKIGLDQEKLTETRKFVLLPKNLTTNEPKISAFHPAVRSKLFDSWKTLVDLYKTFMEIKHKQFLKSFVFKQNDVGNEQLDFVRLVRFRLILIV